MFVSIRQRVCRRNIPLIVSVAALVFAMAGGAWAAKNGVIIKKLSQISPSVQRQLKGKEGAPGPAGPKGDAGAKGDVGPKGDIGPKGDKGDAGTSGTNGKTILSGSAVPSAGTGTDGDFYIRTTTSEIYGPKTAGAWGSPTPLKGAEGAEGSPWTAGGTLPEDATETGSWALIFNTEGFVPISFPIPLAAPVPSGQAISYAAATPEEKENCDDGTSPAPSAANPEADPGYLCVFTAQFSAGGGVLGIFAAGSAGFEGGTSTSGAFLFLESAGADAGYGTFAVTGE